MNTIDHYWTMARYNRLMNERLYAVASELSDEERKRDLGAFFRSVHGTLNHLLLADRAWLGRFTHDRAVFESLDAEGRPITLTGTLDQELYADFTALCRERAQTDVAIENFVEGLTPERLVTPLTYRTSKGERCEHPLWWALSHFFNHQTHHRGQVTTLLFQLGHDPGVTDLIAFLREGLVSC